MTFLPLIAAVFKLFVSKEVMAPFDTGLAADGERVPAVKAC
jgi:hypothetical protein